MFLFLLFCDCDICSFSPLYLATITLGDEALAAPITQREMSIMVSPNVNGSFLPRRHLPDKFIRDDSCGATAHDEPLQDGVGRGDVDGDLGHHVVRPLEALQSLKRECRTLIIESV